MVGMRAGMQREWLIGQQLNQLGSEGSEDVPGAALFPVSLGLTAV